MFGSTRMVRPGVIEPAIAIVEEAPFLNPEQKRERDITRGDSGVCDFVTGAQKRYCVPMAQDQTPIARVSFLCPTWNANFWIQSGDSRTVVKLMAVGSYVKLRSR